MSIGSHFPENDAVSAADKLMLAQQSRANMKTQLDEQMQNLHAPVHDLSRAGSIIDDRHRRIQAMRGDVASLDEEISRLQLQIVAENPPKAREEQNGRMLVDPFSGQPFTRHNAEQALAQMHAKLNEEVRRLNSRLLASPDNPRLHSAIKLGFEERVAALRANIARHEQLIEVAFPGPQPVTPRSIGVVNEISADQLAVREVRTVDGDIVKIDATLEDVWDKLRRGETMPKDVVISGVWHGKPITAEHGNPITAIEDITHLTIQAHEMRSAALFSAAAAQPIHETQHDTRGTLSVEFVASLAHEVNRAYCEALGDCSQAEWCDAPEWQQKSAINGVRFMLASPDATPEMSHENWLREKEAAGWVWGEHKNPVKREHPCVRAYADLPLEQRVKDHLFRAVVLTCAPLIGEERLEK